MRSSSKWRVAVLLCGCAGVMGGSAFGNSDRAPVLKFRQFDCAFEGSVKGATQCESRAILCPIILTPSVQETCVNTLKVRCNGNEVYDGTYGLGRIGFSKVVFQGLTSTEYPTPPGVEITENLMLAVPPSFPGVLHLPSGDLEGTCTLTEVPFTPSN